LIGQIHLMRTLIIDIETRPNLAYVWGLWDQNVGLNQIAEVGSVISFAAKWHKSRTVLFASDFHNGHDEMVCKAWELVDEADAIVHYNGKAFDMKHLNREFLLAGLGPPSPHNDIDLLTTVKNRFKFVSNKLDHVSRQLELGQKVQHNGFELWLACMRNDERAWATMRKYNKHDVTLTEELYDVLLPWIKSHPNRAVIDNAGEVCPRCASKELQRRGYRHLATATYKQFQCMSCRSYFRAVKQEPIASTFRQ
jgi:DNA polymerase elongation subunit (family B)